MIARGLCAGGVAAHNHPVRPTSDERSKSMRRLAVVIAALSIQAGAVIAQKPEVPQPGPEHQRLGAFVGNWTFENFFVQRLYQGKAPMGEVQGLEVSG
jgi:hypothetical protein